MDFKDMNWEQKRVVILKRDNYRCQTCYRAKEEVTKAGDWLECHHKPMTYQGQYGTWETKDELIILCNVCHEEITNARRKIQNRDFSKKATLNSVKPPWAGKSKLTQNGRNQNGNDHIQATRNPAANHAQWKSSQPSESGGEID
jgi:hypothetical protein